MTETTILDRPDDLTIHICCNCHCTIRGAARRITERGVVQYEHPFECIDDPDRYCRTGEAEEIVR